MLSHTLIAKACHELGTSAHCPEHGTLKAVTYLGDGKPKAYCPTCYASTLVLVTRRRTYPAIDDEANACVPGCQPPHWVYETLRGTIVC